MYAMRKKRREICLEQQQIGGKKKSAHKQFQISKSIKKAKFIGKHNLDFSKPKT